jgi:hypothetical protein
MTGRLVELVSARLKDPRTGEKKATKLRDHAVPVKRGPPVSGPKEAHHRGRGRAVTTKPQFLESAVILVTGQEWQRAAQIKSSGRRLNAKAVVSAMPVVSAKARARSVAIFFMAVPPLG